MLDALLGPLGGIMAGAVAVVLALVFGRYTGGRDARAKREAQDGQDYIKERGKIDDEISGIGGSDRDTVERLREIADRRGKRKN